MAKIPYAKKQGIFAAEQGICRRGGASKSLRGQFQDVRELKRTQKSVRMEQEQCRDGLALSFQARAYLRVQGGKGGKVCQWFSAADRPTIREFVDRLPLKEPICEQYSMAFWSNIGFITRN